jgi:tetratricopeptide (TPR) repeat protein
VLVVLLLFGAAVAGKEHVALLPLVLLLTDYYWNPGFSFVGIRRNWRLYGTLAVLAAIMGSALYTYLAHEPTVGFHMKEFTWYQYLFTQCRVLFIYLRLFLFPVGQNADYNIALSHRPFEEGAILGMALLAGAAVAAFVWRKRFPIASFGFFVALIFFLPTSSIMPIRDLAAERRVYLPMIGLLLMVAEFLVRLRWNERVLAGVLAGIVASAGLLTWNRSQVWASPVALWSDTVEKSPGKARPHLGLAAADFGAHRSPEAAVQYDLANRLDSHYDATFYANWAAALEGAGRHQEALQMGRKAVQMGPTAATFDALSRIVALNGDIPQALELLDKGEKSDPAYLPTYIDRADILMAVDRNTEACAAFLKARSLDRRNPSASRGLAALRCPGAN